MSLKKRKRGNGTKKKVKKKCPEWYDMNLSLMKRELNYQANLLQKHVNDPFIRSSFSKHLKLFRKERKRKKRQFTEDILNRLDNRHDSNPKAYWDLLDQLRNADQRTGKETNVKLSDWKEYFEDFNNNVKDHIDTKIENSLNEVENTPIFNELDMFPYLNLR